MRSWICIKWPTDSFKVTGISAAGLDEAAAFISAHCEAGAQPSTNAAAKTKSGVNFAVTNLCNFVPFLYRMWLTPSALIPARPETVSIFKFVNPPIDKTQAFVLSFDTNQA